MYLATFWTCAKTNRRLLEVLYVRQREEGPIILRIGDIFLQSAAEFRFAYPTYIGHFPISEKRLKDETEANPQLKIFLDVRSFVLAALCVLTFRPFH